MYLEQSFGVIPVLKELLGPQYLIVKKINGHWGFPKGHADEGERPMTSAMREFEEETGIEDYRIISDVVFEESYVKKTNSLNGVKAVSKRVLYFIGITRDRNVTIDKSELEEFAWLSYEEALPRLTYNESKKILEKAHIFLLSRDE